MGKFKMMSILKRCRLSDIFFPYPTTVPLVTIDKRWKRLFQSNFRGPKDATNALPLLKVALPSAATCHRSRCWAPGNHRVAMEL